MPDIEKVIRNLQILWTMCEVNPDYGMGLDVEQCREATEWISDAVALLKEQEPRVIRLQDAEAMRLCWVEKRFPHTIRPAQIMRFGDDSPNITIFSIHQIPTDWPVCEFGSEWRCWDKEPTNEQMEAAKWDD